MLYILYIISALFLLITIFFIKVNYLIYIAIAFFILHIIFTKSIFMTIKKLLYLIPYFLAIFIIQALNSRGEYYNLFGFYIDKVGTDFTIIYFIRIASVLYFLSIFFIIIKKLKVPNGYIFDEMIRISIFMKIVRKSFFAEFGKIRDKNKTFQEKLNLIKNLLENVYNDSFKLYPYDMLISHYRNLKK
ncbi:hypothetical protein R4J03_01985 [Brachyspira intermedia]|uniref:hypothetical protein n=1 Tax=Brachyspira intermedia TaxID=84377 RepID=UPI002611C35C|nr:hypothetical protein [uncultured Brachyspira sp.]